VSSPALHGREHPLGELRARLSAAQAGRGQLVLVSGDPGIGKTALATALASEAEAGGAAVTWGRAWEFAEAPPYFPVRPCLRALSIEPGGEDFELWERVVAELARAAGDRPVVWLIEDVHAADLQTLDLLAFLVQPLRTMAALVVATLRPQDPRLDERRLRRIARMARDGGELRLEPLAEAELAAVAEDVSGRPVPARVRRRLAELTGGNPLFAVECARSFRAAGGVESAIEQVPATVRQVVVERVATLPEAARDALASAAVIGREFSAAVVARMHDVLPALVIDALLPAVRAGIVRELRPGQFLFHHGLVRDALEDILGDVERARRHDRAGRALAAVGDTAEILIERARHALAGLLVGDPADALVLARRATDLLEREGAHDRAFELHARVADARAAGFLPPASPLELLHVARIAREAGRADVARRTCEAVAAAARVAEDPELLASAALLHAVEVRPGMIDPVQIGLLEEARRELGEGSAMLPRVLARLATALQPADDPAAPNRLARDALRRARLIGDDALVLDVLELGGLGMHGAPRGERVAWSEELRDRALAAGDPVRALTAWIWLAFWCGEAGDLAGVERATGSALALSDEIGHPRHRWAPLLLASGNAIARGRFAESERHLTEVVQIAALIDDPSLALSIVVHRLRRAWLLGRRSELLADLEQLDGVIGGVKRGGLFAAVQRASCAARLGDVAAARAELARIGAESRALAGDVEGLVEYAGPCALVGTDAERRWVRAELAAATSVEVHDMGVGFVYGGSVMRARGLLDAALGDLDAAERALRATYHHEQRQGRPPWIAQAAHELAAVLRERGRGDEARAFAAEAAALARELGMALPDGAGPDAAEAPTAPRAAALRMLRSGDVWTVERGAVVARVKDSRGMQLLARLVERAGEEIHVLVLASDEGAGLPDSDAGELLDEAARKAYRRRLTELDEILARTEAAGDVAGASRIEAERRALVGELARASGLGGRSRRAGSATERARINVQRRLKDAVTRLGEVDPELGRFLDRAVRTGTFCCFRE
jgi:tetratricopeptide (TPR) repeat protein